MELKVKLYLENNGEKFMGVGVLWLLDKVKELGSLRSAAKALDMSYTKAYKMISNLENALGQQILVRHKGGQERNGASLTPFAQDFIIIYDEFQKDCKRKLEEPYEEFLMKLSEVSNGKA